MITSTTEFHSRIGQTTVFFASLSVEEGQHHYCNYDMTLLNLGHSYYVICIRNLNQEAWGLPNSMLLQVLGLSQCDWPLYVIMPIFKKGDSHECKNNHGISLLSINGKDFMKIIQSQLQQHCEQMSHEKQARFRVFTEAVVRIVMSN